mmetsp:Transcript_8832/g.14489  ORF Transcript_8832/g.14489 Transcript_8832/m.14489 type:complete len:206 (+) Transcript_8832:208-825(+)
MAGKIDNTDRRTWDVEEYAEKAKERLKELEETYGGDSSGDERKRKKPKPPVVKRAPLQARGFQLNLKSKLGKTQVITTNTPTNQKGGYFCDICDCAVKDSSNYLDHINGKKHQRALGMSLRVERSSLDSIKQKFDSNKRTPSTITEGLSLDERIKKHEEEEEQRKEQQKERKRQKVVEEAPPVDEEEEERLAMMGLPMNFGSSKK